MGQFQKNQRVLIALHIAADLAGVLDIVRGLDQADPQQCLSDLEDVFTRLQLATNSVNRLMKIIQSL